VQTLKRRELIAALGSAAVGWPCAPRAARLHPSDCVGDAVSRYPERNGGYAIKLLRLQNDMIQTFERYRRGNKQTGAALHFERKDIAPHTPAR
jgi:hypothetical protein